MYVDEAVNQLMKKGFTIKRLEGGRRIEATLRDEKFIILPDQNMWMYIRGEGESVYGKAFMDLSLLFKKLEEVRTSTLE